MALAGIGKRRTPKSHSTLRTTRSPKMKRNSQPLFVPDSDEDLPPLPAADDDDDAVMQLALQESLESQENTVLQRALEVSRNEFQERLAMEAPSTAGTSLDVSEILTSEASDGDELNVPGRLETALAIANAGPTPKSISMARRSSSSFREASVFPAPKLLIDRPSPSPDPSEDASLEYLDEIIDETSPAVLPIVGPHATPKTAHVFPESTPFPTKADEFPQVDSVEEQVGDVSDSDEDMELVPVSIPGNQLLAPMSILETPKPKDVVSTPRSATKVHFDNIPTATKARSPESDAQHPGRKAVLTPGPEQSDEEHVISDWSRSPSPVADVLLATETPASKASVVEDSWDAAQEMDLHAEEGEFARFLSQVKGKDLDDVRREIDEEIKTLNQQKKAAMRDSEDITQQMIAQIMVRSPYDACLFSFRTLTTLQRCCSACSVSRTSRPPWRRRRSARRSSSLVSSRASSRMTRTCFSSVGHGYTRICSISPRPSSAFSWPTLRARLASIARSSCNSHIS